MTIRKASIEDIDKILPIRLEIHQYHVELDKLYEAKVDLKDKFKTQLELILTESSELVLVAEEEGNILGYALGKLKDPHFLFNHPRSGHIDDVGITASARNKGIGEKLVHELVNWFKSNGAERIDLKVHAGNESGITFWKKMGFTDFMHEMHKAI